MMLMATPVLLITAGDRVLILFSNPSIFAQYRPPGAEREGTVVAFAGEGDEWAKVRVGLFKRVWVKTDLLKKVSA